MNKVMLLTTIT